MYESRDPCRVAGHGMLGALLGLAILSVSNTVSLAVPDHLLIHEVDGHDATQMLSGEVRVYDPVTHALVDTLTTPNVNDQWDFFGLSASEIHDLDGDGVKEIAVSAPLVGWHRSNRIGACYIYSSADFSEPLMTLEMGGPGILGWATSSTRDWDGDGFNDLISLCAMSVGGPTLVDGWIVHSSATGEVVTSGSDPQVAWEAFAAQQGSISVPSPNGDLDGDLDVDYDDLWEVLNNLDTVVPFGSAGDLVPDGVLDSNDLAVLFPMVTTQLEERYDAMPLVGVDQTGSWVVQGLYDRIEAMSSIGIPGADCDCDGDPDCTMADISCSGSNPAVLPPCPRPFISVIIFRHDLFQSACETCQIFTFVVPCSVTVHIQYFPPIPIDQLDHIGGGGITGCVGGDVPIHLTGRTTLLPGDEGEFFASNLPQGHNPTWDAIPSRPGVDMPQDIVNVTDNQGRMFRYDVLSTAQGGDSIFVGCNTYVTSCFYTGQRTVEIVDQPTLMFTGNMTYPGSIDGKLVAHPDAVGGTFSWSVVSGASLIAFTNIGTSGSELDFTAGSTPGEVELSVTYTYTTDSNTVVVVTQPVSIIIQSVS